MQYLVQYSPSLLGKVVNAPSAEQAVEDVARTEMTARDYLFDVRVFLLTHEADFKVNSQIDVKRV